ncbi:hypothetical protein SAMN05444679_103214 [Variovorax sp. CF079]|uniref:hypothetical protein n=1 Tax=Variovorax sp. CF079 TaxID=1882774 RepID=UPI00088CE1F5|nr:hypothetical protein [Variovorax sp. CF079]SDC49591.1 hypothetical protein SAMN05444679_103214 [Variovorax sp. CF079]
MKNFIQLFLADGKLTGLGVAILFLVGVLILLGSMAFLPMVWMRWLGASLGLGCMAVAGLSGRAHALGLPPPFTNDPLGWRKAKATYKQKPGPEADSSSSSASQQSESEKK